MPQMTRIRSASVVAVGYDESRHELSVKFVSGDTYLYAMVPPSVYRSLLEAESVGRFVNASIKPTYPVRSAA
jgi:hypothetical protein